MTETTNRVTIKVIQKGLSEHLHDWRWSPKTNMKTVKYSDLVVTIPIPQLIEREEVLYSVPEMAKYGWN